MIICYLHKLLGYMYVTTFSGEFCKYRFVIKEQQNILRHDLFAYILQV